MVNGRVAACHRSYVRKFTHVRTGRVTKNQKKGVLFLNQKNGWIVSSYGAVFRVFLVIWSGVFRVSWVKVQCFWLVAVCKWAGLSFSGWKWRDLHVKGF